MSRKSNVILEIAFLILLSHAHAYSSLGRMHFSLRMRTDGDNAPSSVTPQLISKSTKNAISSAFSTFLLPLSTLMIPKIANAGPAFQDNVDTFFPTQSNPYPPPPQKNNRQLAYSVEVTDPPCLLPRTHVGEASAIRFVNNDDLSLKR